MASKKRIFWVIPLLVILSVVGYHIYATRFKIEQYNRTLVPLDKENFLITTSLSTEKSKSYYIARSHIKKGIIWKYPIDDYSISSFYEERFRRDVMLKDNELSFYLESEETLYKFNYEDGTVIERKTIPLSTHYIYNWAALQDQDSLYLISKGSDDLSHLIAVNFQSFATRWTIPLGNVDLRNRYTYPLQSEGWIALHKKSPEGKTVLLINKKSGRTLSLDVREYGFLVEDSYYCIPEYSDENQTPYFTRVDLTHAQRTPLYIWDEPSPEKDNSSLDYPLWNFRNNLIYISEKTGSVLKARDLQTGVLQWELPLPKGFKYIGSEDGSLQAGAPEFSGIPYIQTPYFPLILGESNSSSFDWDAIHTKICIIQMEKGEIHWESNPVYQPKQYLQRNLEQGNFYKDGEYCLYLSIPERKDPTDSALLFIAGETGERMACVSFFKKYDPFKEFSPLSTFSLQDQTLRSIPGRSFSFSDKVVYPPGDGRRTRAARQYKFENADKELEEIYGF